MTRTKLFDLAFLATALLAVACSSDTPSDGTPALSATGAGGNGGDGGSGASGSNTPSATMPGPTVPSPTTPGNTATAPLVPSTPATPGVNTGGASGMPTAGGGMAPVASGGAPPGGGGMANVPDCEVVVSFDEPWGGVATGGGTNPMEWETSVTPTIANGVFSVEVPFATSLQQFGWNGDYPGGPIDCTGRELVARVRLLSGFVEDPQTMPGGLQMYLFSNEWGNSLSTWSNVPAPSEEWFEVSVGCAASAESAFDPALVNGIGFTFNTGGEDATSYTATPAAFEVDHLCWRGAATDPGMGGAGGTSAGGAAGMGGAVSEGGAAGMMSSGGMGGESLAGAGGEPAGGAGGALGGAGAGGVGGAGGVNAGGAAGMSSGGAGGTSGGAGGMSGGAGGMSGGGAGGAPTDDCDIVVSFDTTWGVVATEGGTVPETWETSVTPVIQDGIFDVLVPFESAAQQFGWVGDHPEGIVDCSGWELVVRARLLSGFVENPTSAPGGVQVYLFSDAWGNSLSAWNNVPAPSTDWFEASVTCDEATGSEFDPATLNGIGFTFNTGGDDPLDYEATEATFEVDHLCWRR